MIHTVLERIRGEYVEMPGLRLTVEQTQRLCGIDRDVCVAVLGALVDATFLRVDANGTYARATDGRMARAQHPHAVMQSHHLPVAG